MKLKDDASILNLELEENYHSSQIKYLDNNRNSLPKYVTILEKDYAKINNICLFSEINNISITWLLNLCVDSIKILGKYENCIHIENVYIPEQSYSDCQKSIIYDGNSTNNWVFEDNKDSNAEALNGGVTRINSWCQTKPRSHTSPTYSDEYQTAKEISSRRGNYFLRGIFSLNEKPNLTYYPADRDMEMRNLPLVILSKDMETKKEILNELRNKLTRIA